MTNELREAACVMIERALSDELELEEASSFLSALPRNTDSTASEAIHAVVHFLTDADLRSRDEAYDRAFRTELENYVQTLGTSSIR